MTGYTVHTGSTEAFAENFDRIFGNKKKAKKTSAGARKSSKITAKKTRARKKK